MDITLRCISKTHRSFTLLWEKFQSVRNGSSWRKRILQREEKKNVVFQYVGEHHKRPDRVYVWGNVVTGALGLKSYLEPDKGKPKKFQMKPSKMYFMDHHNYKVQDVSCGYGYTVWLVQSREGQKLLGSGINTNSQLGVHHPPKSDQLLDCLIDPLEIQLPLLCPSETKVKSVSCGRAHTLVLTDNEGVFSIGNNAHGQCGKPIVEHGTASQPVINKVDIGEDVSQIVCGCDHTLFLTNKGDMYSCGIGADGQTGLGHYDCVGTPVKVKGDIEGEHIIQVSSKADTVLAVSDKGDVFGWGNSEYNQLGKVSNSTQINTPRHLPFKRIDRVKTVAAGGTICSLLTEVGDVYVWGFGILGKGPALEECTEPSKVPKTLFGRNEFNPSSTVVDLQCGMNYFVAQTNKGEIYSWGKNATASLGLGHCNDQYFPLKVSVPSEVRKVFCGLDHTIALTKAFA